MSKVAQINTIALSSFLQEHDQELWGKYSLEYTDLFAFLPSNLVRHHKDRLGKQKFCFSNNRRYWVWKEDGWCVYVNNDVGAQFEVEPGCSVEEAWDFWLEYKKNLQFIGDPS